MLKFSPKIFVCAEPERGIKQHYETICSCSKCDKIISTIVSENKDYEIEMVSSISNCFNCNEPYFNCLIKF